MSGLPLWESHLDDQDGSRIVSLTGELDLAVADDLRRTLIDQLDRPGAGPVVADLAGVTFVDSAALGAFIAAYQHALEVDGRFVVAHAVHGVRRIMQIAGVYDLLSPAGAG